MGINNNFKQYGDKMYTYCQFLQSLTIQALTIAVFKKIVLEEMISINFIRFDQGWLI